MAVQRLASTQLEYSKPFLERIRPNFGLRHLDTCGSRIRAGRMACQADKMACKPKCRAWACDATKIHAHARNKPFGAGASHFCKPKSQLSPEGHSIWINLDGDERKKVHKKSILRTFMGPTLDIANAKSHDRLLRIRCFSDGGDHSDRAASKLHSNIKDEHLLKLHGLFATLVAFDISKVVLTVLQCTVIKITNKSPPVYLDAAPIAEIALPDSRYEVTGQVLSLVPFMSSSRTLDWAWTTDFVEFESAIESETDNCCGPCHSNAPSYHCCQWPPCPSIVAYRFPAGFHRRNSQCDHSRFSRAVGKDVKWVLIFHTVYLQSKPPVQKIVVGNAAFVRRMFPPRIGKTMAVLWRSKCTFNPARNFQSPRYKNRSFDPLRAKNRDISDFI
ncbi:hypothetical protein B0H13DRAFT_1923062 [Mycena leptocephala]|nr:hypothetical protein B0H13DRAFT_1923062 [Mycena leptocephala]